MLFDIEVDRVLVGFDTKNGILEFRFSPGILALYVELNYASLFRIITVEPFGTGNSSLMTSNAFFLIHLHDGQVLDGLCYCPSGRPCAFL